MLPQAGPVTSVRSEPTVKESRGRVWRSISSLTCMLSWCQAIGRAGGCSARRHVELNVVNVEVPARDAPDLGRGPGAVDQVQEGVILRQDVREGAQPVRSQVRAPSRAIVLPDIESGLGRQEFLDERIEVVRVRVPSQSETRMFWFAGIERPMSIPFSLSHRLGSDEALRSAIRARMISLPGPVQYNGPWWCRSNLMPGARPDPD